MASEYLTLGRGEVWFAPFASGTKTPKGYRFLGNCPAFNLNVTFEELNHFDSTNGFREEDESIITQRQIMSTITCDDLKPQNLAWFFMGSDSTVTQSSVTGETYDIADVEFDTVYQIGAADGTPTGLRSVTVDSVEADPTGTPVSFTEDDDYEIVDADRGLIRFLDSGNYSEGDTVQITYDLAAVSSPQVVSGRAQIEGALMFLAKNAAGNNVDYRMPYAKIRPTGDLALIGEDWATMEFDVKGLVLANRQLLYANGQPVA